jgi:hypothetical protein
MRDYLEEKRIPEKGQTGSVRSCAFGATRRMAIGMAANPLNHCLQLLNRSQTRKAIRGNFGREK